MSYNWTSDEIARRLAEINGWGVVGDPAPQAMPTQPSYTAQPAQPSYTEPAAQPEILQPAGGTRGTVWTEDMVTQRLQAVKDAQQLTTQGGAGDGPSFGMNDSPAVRDTQAGRAMYAGERMHARPGTAAALMQPQDILGPNALYAMSDNRQQAALDAARASQQAKEDAEYKAYLDRAREASAMMQANAAAMGNMNPALMDGGAAAIREAENAWKDRAQKDAEAASRAAAMRRAEHAFDDAGQYDGSLTVDERLLGVRSYLADKDNKAAYIALQNARARGQASVRALEASGLYTPEELARAGMYLDMSDSLSAGDRLWSGARSVGSAIAGGAGQTVGGLLGLGESLYGGPNAQYLLEQDDFMRGFSNTSPTVPKDMTGVNPIDPEGTAARVLNGSADLQQYALRNLPEGTAARWLGQAGVSAAQNLSTRAVDLVAPGAGLGVMAAGEIGAKTYELERQGKSPEEALARGAIAGGTELFTEMAPLDSWLELIKTGGGDSLIWDMIEQMAGEATEEMVGDVIEQLTDLAFDDPEARGSLAGFVGQAIKNYNLRQTLEAGAQGAVSAGMMDAPAIVTNITGRAGRGAQADPATAASGGSREQDPAQRSASASEAATREPGTARGAQAVQAQNAVQRAVQEAPAEQAEAAAQAAATEAGQATQAQTDVQQLETLRKKGSFEEQKAFLQAQGVEVTTKAEARAALRQLEAEAIQADPATAASGGSREQDLAPQSASASEAATREPGTARGVQVEQAKNAMQDAVRDAQAEQTVQEADAVQAIQAEQAAQPAEKPFIGGMIVTDPATGKSRFAGTGSEQADAAAVQQNAGSAATVQQSTQEGGKPFVGGIIRQNAETGRWESAPARAAKTTIAETKPVAAEAVAPAVRELAGQFSKKTGIQVEFFEGDNTRRGYEKNGVLHLNANITEQAAAVRTLIHEAAHSAEGSEGYARMRSAIEGSTAFTQALEKYMGQQGATLDAAAAQKQGEYARQGVDLTLEEARNEVIAQFCEENLFTDEKGVRELVQKDRTLARRVLDWVRNMIDTVTGARARAELRRIEGLYLDALGQEGTRDGTVKNAFGNLSDFTKSQIEDWKNSKNIVIYESEGQLDDFLKKAYARENPGERMYLGIIPKATSDMVMNATGVNIRNYNVSLGSDEVRKVTVNSHGNQQQENLRGQRAVTLEDLKKYPDVIMHPDSVILDSELHQNRQVLQFVKKLDSRTEVRAFVSRKHNELGLLTMFISNKNDALATAAGANSSLPTAKPDSSTGVTTTISNPANSVNTQGTSNSLSTGASMALSEEERSTGFAGRAARMMENGSSVTAAIMETARRYSDLSERTKERLARENSTSWAKLAETPAEQRGGQMKALDSAADVLAGKLLRQFKSKADRAALRESLKSLYAGMETGDISIRDAEQQAQELARGLAGDTAPDAQALEGAARGILEGYIDGKLRGERVRMKLDQQREVRRLAKKAIENMDTDSYAYREELSKVRKSVEQMSTRLAQKLVQPTKAKHIPADVRILQSVHSIASDMLCMINTRYAGKDTLSQMGQKLTGLHKALSDTKAWQGVEYEGFKNKPFMKNLAELANEINHLTTDENGKAIQFKQADLETMRDIQNALQWVETEIANADKLLSETIGAEHRESVKATAAAITRDIGAARGSAARNRTWTRAIAKLPGDGLAWFSSHAALNGIRMARMYSGYVENGAFEQVVRALNDGQMKANMIKAEAGEIFRDVCDSNFGSLAWLPGRGDTPNSHGFTRRDFQRFCGRQAELLDVGFTDARTGDTVYLTPAMRTELVMHLQNEHNLYRILHGGLEVPDAELMRKGKVADAVAKGHLVKFDLTDGWGGEGLQKLLSVAEGMSDYERMWMEDAKKYFWEYSGAQYNKATLPLWGYAAANVEHYYPAASDKKYLYQDVDARGTDNYTVENNGNLKNRVTNATQPIALNEINRTVTKSINTMSRFCGMAMPMSDWEKIYNYQSGDRLISTKAMLGSVWGNDSFKFLDKLTADLNGNKKGSDGGEIFNTIRGNYATSVLFMNLGTTMKQLASWPTAAARLGWNAVIKGLGAKVTQSDIAEINKRVDTLALRNGSDTGRLLEEKGMWRGVFSMKAGTGSSVYDMGSTAGPLASAVNRIPGAGWISKADTATVAKLIGAAKVYVEAEANAPKAGTAEYWDRVAQVYRETVEMTQPNSGVMQKTALGRSDSALVRGLSMFSNQRLQNIGLLIDAACDYNAQVQRGASKESRARAARNLYNAASALAVQCAVIGVMELARKAVWRRMDDYRDETGQITSKSLLERVALDSLDSALSNVIGGYDILKMGQAFLNGDTYNGPELVELTAITDTVNAMTAYGKACKEYSEAKGGDGEEKALKQLKDKGWRLAEKAGQLLGVPVANARKNWDGLFGGVQDLLAGDGWLGKYEYTTANAKAMVQEYMSGAWDAEGTSEMLEKWIESSEGAPPAEMGASDLKEALKKARTALNADWKNVYLEADDAGRKEIADRLLGLTIGGEHVYTPDVFDGWVKNAEGAAARAGAEGERTDMYDTVMAALAEDAGYKGMTGEQQGKVEGIVSEAAKQAALVETGGKGIEDIDHHYAALYSYAQKGKAEYTDLVREYAVLAAKVPGNKKADRLETLKKSGLDQERQALYYMAMMPSNDKCGQIYKDKGMDGLVAWYRMQSEADTNKDGKVSKTEGKPWVENNIMNAVLRDYIKNMMKWK